MIIEGQKIDYDHVIKLIDSTREAYPDSFFDTDLNVAKRDFKHNYGYFGPQIVKQQQMSFCVLLFII